MADIIQLRRGTAAAWTAANPTLASGEMGLETDTRKTKTGDGTTAWTSLNYNIIQMSGDVTLSAAGVATIANNAVTYAKIQEGSAYSTLANNTSGTTEYAEVYFRDQDVQTYGGTITWNGTPPTTVISQQYKWIRIGKWVTITLAIVYTNAGVTNTTVAFTLPTDCPTPSNIAGMGASASEAMYMGVGRLEPSTTSTPGNNRSYIRKNATNDGYEVVVTAASASAKVAGFTITYYTT